MLVPTCFNPLVACPPPMPEVGGSKPPGDTDRAIPPNAFITNLTLGMSLEIGCILHR